MLAKTERPWVNSFVTHFISLTSSSTVLTSKKWTARLLGLLTPCSAGTTFHPLRMNTECTPQDRQPYAQPIFHVKLGQPCLAWTASWLLKAAMRFQRLLAELTGTLKSRTIATSLKDRTLTNSTNEKYCATSSNAFDHEAFLARV